MGLIEEFITRYAKEYDFYERASRLVVEALEADLKATGVRCIVTGRAKSIDRLEAKCRQREAKLPGKSYSSVEDIFQDIVDLAGVRVALYFPSEQAQVEKIIDRLFTIIEKKEFPDRSKVRPGSPRFNGYCATHYRVQLDKSGRSEIEKRYAAARVEIQVASVLMHSWSEVEHDLVYKPLGGNLSEEEYATLDQLNGLVMAGEIALESLQRAGEKRIAEHGRKFENHYELAAHLINQPTITAEVPINDSEIGRVDLLFDLLCELGLNSPGDLSSYLEALHSNLEKRPLAEQVVDALITEDSSRYTVYRDVRARHATYERDTHLQDLDSSVGRFLQNWIRLEKLDRGVAPIVDTGARRPIRPVGHWLWSEGAIDQKIFREIRALRRLRNDVVHGITLPPASELSDAADLLDTIIALIENGKGKEDDPSS